MTDDLDTRLRGLVARAVADAPPAPPTPSAATVRPAAPARAPRRSFGWAWAGAAVAATVALVAGVAVLGGDDDPGRVGPATNPTGPTEPTTPVAPDSTYPPVVGWREDLVVIVASADGIERVWAEQGAIAQAQYAQPLVGDVAFELADGTVVSDEGLMDVGLDGQALYSGTWAGFSAVYQYPLGGTRPENPLMIPFDGEPTRLTYSADLVVGEGDLFAGGRTPIMFTQDGQMDISTFLAAGVTPPLGNNDEPRLFSVSPTGGTVVWVDGNELVVSDGGEPRRLGMGDASKVVELDVSDSYAALTRADGRGSVVDLRDGSVFEVPTSGRVTLSLQAADPGEGQGPDPVDTTPGTPTTTIAPSPTPGETTTLPTPATWTVLDVGPNGVVQRGGNGSTLVWTTEPMAAAVVAPDGSLIVQRRSGYPGVTEHTMADTLPLRIATPGAAPVSLFGEAAEPVDAWYIVHDATTVDGRPLLLMERQYVQDGFDSEAGDLLTMDLGTGEIVMVDDQFAGWEQGSSRLHLAQTGLVLGEFYDSATASFFAINVLGDVAVPTAAGLGLESSYGDCAECPRRYTVSRAGDTIAWLDGNELVVHSATGSEERRYDLGTMAVGVADLAIGDGFVVLSYGYAWLDDVDPPLVVAYTVDRVEQLSGRTAVIAG